MMPGNQGAANALPGSGALKRCRAACSLTPFSGPNDPGARRLCVVCLHKFKIRLVYVDRFAVFEFNRSGAISNTSATV